MKRLACVLLVSCYGLASASLPRSWLDRLGHTAMLNGWGHVLDGYGYTNDPLGLRTNVTRNLGLTANSDGNLTNDGTRSFAYDAEDRLATNWVAGAWKSEFVYDGLGRRRIERDYSWNSSAWLSTSETHYIYDGWLVIQERNGANAVQVTYTRGLDLSGTLQYAGGIGGLLARTDGNGSTFYHSDGAGNITGPVDANENMAARYLYGAFGRVTAQWGPLAAVNAMQFSSMPRHANSGMSLYPFRAYGPTFQRFLNHDPIGESGGINLHGFVGNSALNRLDPFGLAYGDWWHPRSYFGSPPGVTVMPNGEL
jgi:RHS repeat-associated protein